MINYEILERLSEKRQFLALETISNQGMLGMLLSQALTKNNFSFAKKVFSRLLDIDFNFKEETIKGYAKMIAFAMARTANWQEFVLFFEERGFPREIAMQTFTVIMAKEKEDIALWVTLKAGMSSLIVINWYFEKGQTTEVSFGNILWGYINDPNIPEVAKKQKIEDLITRAVVKGDDETAQAGKQFVKNGTLPSFEIVKPTVSVL